MNTTTRNQQTAAQTYTVRAAEIALQIAKLQANLARHAERAAGSSNWGYAGDLHSIEKQLAEINAAFSAVAA